MNPPSHQAGEGRDGGVSGGEWIRRCFQNHADARQQRLPGDYHPRIFVHTAAGRSGGPAINFFSPPQCQSLKANLIFWSIIIKADSIVPYNARVTVSIIRILIAILFCGQRVASRPCMFMSTKESARAFNALSLPRPYAHKPLSNCSNRVAITTWPKSDGWHKSADKPSDRSSTSQPSIKRRFGRSPRAVTSSRRILRKSSSQ